MTITKEEAERLAPPVYVVYSVMHYAEPIFVAGFNNHAHAMDLKRRLEASEHLKGIRWYVQGCPVVPVDEAVEQALRNIARRRGMDLSGDSKL